MSVQISLYKILFTRGPFQADQNFCRWLTDIVSNKNGQYIMSHCSVQMFSTTVLPGVRMIFTSDTQGLDLRRESIVACTASYAKQISLLSHGSHLIVIRLVVTARSDFIHATGIYLSLGSYRLNFTIKTKKCGLYRVNLL